MIGRAPSHRSIRSAGSRWERHGWLVFLLLGTGAILAAPLMLLGNPPDPPSAERFTGLTLAEIGQRVPGVSGYIASISRQLGNFMLVMGVLLSGIAAGPFRRGERWAWYALWTVPVMLLVQFTNSDWGLGWQLDLALIPVTGGILVLSYRRFFPRSMS